MCSLATPDIRVSNVQWTAGDMTLVNDGSTFDLIVSSSALEVRLPADIAEAALRTPDTALTGERGWVRFTPPTDERHVTDRATAWLQTAWRHAAET